jgi:hypothetical protein
VRPIFILKNMGYIYILVDKRNGKKYVGKHNGNKKDYWTSGVVPNRIAKKYGKDIFERIILEDNIPNDKLNEREMRYITEHDSFKNGYNSTIGGDGGGQWIYLKTEEEIEKIANVKSKKLTGRVFSEETKKKMSESGKKKVITKEHKENISKGVKLRGGYPHTEETKLRLSKIMSGRKNEKHSKFMLENNPNIQKVSIEGEIYKSLKDVCVKLNMTLPSVRYRLNSKSEKYKNWIRIK